MAKTAFKLTQDRLSPDVRPQDDFYEFVNKKWISTTEIPRDKGRWGVFDELQERNFSNLHKLIKGIPTQGGNDRIEQMVADFFESAHHQDIEMNGISELSKLFAQIDEVDSQSSLAHIIATLHLIGVHVFWQPYVERDEENSAKYILRFQQAGLSLPDRDYYIAKTESKSKLRSGYKRHIGRMFDLDSKLKQSATAHRDVYSIEYNLARASMTPVQLRDIYAQYNKFTDNQLVNAYKNIDWELYFNTLGIDRPSELLVDQPAFMERVNQLMSSKGLQQIKRYLRWHLLRAGAKRMGDKFAQANFDFFGKTLCGVQPMEPRWKRAINDIDSAIGEALGRLYIEKYFPSTAKKRVEVLVEDIRKAYTHRMEQLDWMDTPTKDYALKKLANIKVKVGHPDELEAYKGLVIDNKNYLANYWRGKEFDSKKELRRLGQPIDPDAWHMTPQTVNAYIDFNANEIAFPAGILQPPFFDHRADDAVNYGGIGSVIGHELTHGFDDKGRQYDKDGNLHDWWDKETSAEFEKRARKMERLANNYQPLPNTALNGKLTLGENIADLGGYEIAYEALQLAQKRRPKSQQKIAGHSQEERFFLNGAIVECDKYRRKLLEVVLTIDPHAPGKFRVNNSFRNMPAFYEVFDVGDTDKMYLDPSKRVHIW